MKQRKWAAALAVCWLAAALCACAAQETPAPAAGGEETMPGISSESTKKPAQAPEGDWVEGEALVCIADGAEAGQVEEALAPAKVTIAEDIGPGIDTGHVYLIRWDGASLSVEQAVETLEQQDFVVFAQPNFVYTAI